MIENFVFGRFELNSSVFEKLLISYSCISFMKYCALRSFCIKLLYFFFKLIFPDFRLIDSISRPIETEKFSVFKFLTKKNFHASFMFRIHMQCIVFCIHLAVLQSYLSLFLHITYIHFAKLGTQLNLKIDWLIFESFIHSSICYFYVWIAGNIFLKRYDG